MIQLHQEVALCTKLVSMAKIKLFYAFVKILAYIKLKPKRKTNLQNLHNSFETSNKEHDRTLHIKTNMLHQN